MEKPGLDQRHRDKHGRLAKKHANTLISQFRRTYGLAFAPGIEGGAKLADVLEELDDHSLAKLIDELERHG
jgi:hypothetical protein